MISLETAKNLENNGDFIAALKLYHEIYSQDNACEEAVLGIAQCALSLDNPEFAFEFFVKLLILNHSNPWGYIGRANVFFRYNQVDRALTDLSRAIKLDDPATELRIDCAALLNDYGYCSIAIQALAPIRSACLHDSDFQCEWLFAQIAENHYDNPDIPWIASQFKAQVTDDPFYALCLAAMNQHNGCPDQEYDVINILTHAPDLIPRAQILGFDIPESLP